MRSPPRLPRHLLEPALRLRPTRLHYRGTQAPRRIFPATTSIEPGTRRRVEASRKLTPCSIRALYIRTRRSQTGVFTVSRRPQSTQATLRADIQISFPTCRFPLNRDRFGGGVSSDPRSSTTLLPHWAVPFISL